MASAGQTAGQLQAKRMRVMDKAVKSWQTQVMSRFFANWKFHINQILVLCYIYH